MTDEEIVKKRERAIALRYHSVSEIPRILAKGYGEIAREIIEVAKSNGIPVKEDETLTELLAKLDVGNKIPEETYSLVAEVLCFLYFTDKEWREKHSHLKDIIEK